MGPFGARFYDRTAWTTIDPLAEKYYSLSPYVYCAGNPIVFVDRDGYLPLLANFVGGVASVSVEYVSQVFGNLAIYGFNTQIFTNVDIVDLGFAFGEGFISAGTNIIKKVGTKAVVSLGVEIAKKTIDVEYDLTSQEVDRSINSAGEVMLDTSLSLIGSRFTTKIPTKVFKTKTANKAVESARKKAHDGGQGLPTDKAKNIANKTRNLNKEKKAANKALHDNVNSALSQGVTSLSQEGLEEERKKQINK